MKSKQHFFLVIASIMWSMFLLSCNKDDDSQEKPIDPTPPVVTPFEREVKGIELKSSVLSTTVKYAVLFPDKYDKTEKKYPVIYLFHGYGDNENAWLDGAKIKNHFDNAVAKGLIEASILVMPQGFNSYYVNRYDGASNYMKMIIEELVKEVDEKYRTKNEKQYRAAMGYSMGGYGAFILATKNLDIFSSSVALSMSWRTDEQYIAEPQGVFNTQFGIIFGAQNETGQGRITSHFKEHSPFYFFDVADASTKYNEVKYYMDCGDDEEQLSITSDQLHALMLEKGIDHEYRMRDGTHTWNYWVGAFDEALKFIDKSFNKIAFEEEDTEVSTHTDALEGNFSAINLEGSLANVGIYLPKGYDTSELNYPVIYVIHDRKGLDDKKSILKILSLVEISFIVDGLSKCLVVEIPANSIKDKNFFEALIRHIDGSYRTIAKTGGRVMMVNNGGGNFIGDVLPYVNASFMYNTIFHVDGIALDCPFYYLDMTDRFEACASYGALYTKLRKENVKHQYRVRNGTDSYTSFLNGIAPSLVYVNQYLEKASK